MYYFIERNTVSNIANKIRNILQIEDIIYPLDIPSYIDQIAALNQIGKNAWWVDNGQLGFGDDYTDLNQQFKGNINMNYQPGCGTYVTNMYQTYYGCTNVTGDPASGPSVITMYQTYENCCNLYGNAACGNAVINLANAYAYCNGLENAACSDSVLNMKGAYYNCVGLVHSPVCGNNVTDFNYAYSGCSNLTGEPACSDSVQYMDNAYYNCFSLTGNAIIGKNVSYLNNAYYNCTNLTGITWDSIKSISSYAHAFEFCNQINWEVSVGSSVVYLNYAFRNCTNIYGSPQCGEKVKYLNYAYENCENLTGEPQCGSAVINMSYAYSNCIRLTGSPVFGPAVTDASNAYYGCIGLNEDATIPKTITNSDNIIALCDNIPYIYFEEGTTKIGNYACQLTTAMIAVPNTVTTIGTNAFLSVPRVCYTGPASGSPWGALEVGDHESTEEPEDRKEPTCTEDGNTGTCHCEYCKTIFTHSIPKLGHDPDITTGICERCGKQLTWREGVSWEVSSKGSYYFVENSSTHEWKSNNKDKHSTSATTTWKVTAPEDYTATIAYKVSSESNYDKLTITLNGVTKVSAISGTKSGTFEAVMTKGTVYTIVATYTKDGSASSGDDAGYITLLPVGEPGWYDPDET